MYMIYLKKFGMTDSKSIDSRKKARMKNELTRHFRSIC